MMGRAPTACIALSMLVCGRAANAQARQPNETRSAYAIEAEHRRAEQRRLDNFYARRAGFFTGFAAGGVATLTMFGYFVLYSRNNVGGLLPGGPQERVLIASVSVAVTTGLLLVASIVNEALAPTPPALMGQDSARAPRWLRFDASGLRF